MKPTSRRIKWWFGGPLLTFALMIALTFSMALPGAALADERPDLVIAVDNLWPTLEPAIGVASTNSRIVPNIFDLLVRRKWVGDPNGNKIGAQLALSWERKGDKVWVVHLRQGVKFHNGEEMTAEDVAFTISSDRLWGPKPFARRSVRYARGITRVEATGRYTVEFETARPDPVLINKMVTPIGFVVPKEYYEKVGKDEFGQKPIGTGPYHMVEFNSGEVARAVAFDDHWAGKPPAKSITWKIVPEPSARLAGLVSGEFDYIVNIPADQESVIEGYEDLVLVKRSIENYPMFAFNMLKTKDLPNNPLVDENLRKAMVMAIDRVGNVKAMWGDATFVPVPFNFPEHGSYYDKERKARYGYNPEEAKKLLAKSVYKGEELSWHITRGFYPNYEAVAEVMVEQWKAVGINVRLDIRDNFALAYKRPFHLLNMSMSSEFTGDPLRPLWVDWGPVSSRVRAKNKTWEATPLFYELGAKFEAEADLKKRKAHYLQLVAEWERVTPGMYLWRNVSTWAHRKGIKWTSTATNTMLFDGEHLSFRK